MGRGHRRQADHWSKKAKRQGFAARSVFKLEEIHKKFQVLKGATCVVDFGCSPGSWSRFVSKRCAGVQLLGVDLQPVEQYPGQFVHGSIAELSADDVQRMLGRPADVVLSDMAPRTTGDRFGDHIRQLELAKLAFEQACKLLKPGGHFVVKVFDGEDANAFVNEVRQVFTKMKRFKPKSTRNESVEFFVVALGKK